MWIYKALVITIMGLLQKYSNAVNWIVKYNYLELYYIKDLNII